MSAATREWRAIDRGEPHGVDGQLNAYVLDVDSSVTGYGRHNRLIVFGGTAGERHLVSVREDVRGLPMSTEADRRRVLNGWQRMHPCGARLEHVSSTPYTSSRGSECVEHEYRIIARGVS